MEEAVRRRAERRGSCAAGGAGATDASRPAPSAADPLRLPRTRRGPRRRRGHPLHAQALVAGVELGVGAVPVHAEERDAPVGIAPRGVPLPGGVEHPAVGQHGRVHVVRQVEGQPPQRRAVRLAATRGWCWATMPASFRSPGFLADEGDLHPGLDARRGERVDRGLVDRVARARGAARDLARLLPAVGLHLEDAPGVGRRALARRTGPTCRRRTRSGSAALSKPLLSTRVRPPGATSTSRPPSPNPAGAVPGARAAAGVPASGYCAITRARGPRARARGVRRRCHRRPWRAPRRGAAAAALLMCAPAARPARRRWRRSRTAGPAGTRRRSSSRAGQPAIPQRPTSRSKARASLARFRNTVAWPMSASRAPAASSSASTASSV